MRRQPAKEWDQYNVGNPVSCMWLDVVGLGCLFGWRLRYPKRTHIYTVDGSEIRLTSWYREYPEISQGFIDNRWCRMSSINSIPFPSRHFLVYDFPFPVWWDMWSFPGGSKGHGHGKQGGFCSVFFSRQFQGRTFCPGRWENFKNLFWFTPWWK